MNLEKIKSQSGYSSLTYFSQEAIADYETIIDQEDLVILKKDKHIHFYAENMNDFVLALKPYEGIEVHFIPEEWVEYLRVNGYYIIADFSEFRCQLRNYDVKIDYLEENEISQALNIAKACENMSRGYKGHSYDFYREWLEGTEVNLKALDLKVHAILKYGHPIQGTLLAAVYNDTLWIRDLSVDPNKHRQGVGSKLMAMAFSFGMKHQAKKAYLMADKKNRSGIKLYKKFGFKASDESEIQMGKVDKSALTIYLNHQVKVTMDRPLGSQHPKYDMVYPINYGYLENTVSGDLQPIDAYVIDQEQALESYEGKVIAIVFRADDIEDKLVVSNQSFSKEQIYEKIKFTEQYFKSSIIMADSKE